MRKLWASILLAAASCTSGGAPAAGAGKTDFCPQCTKFCGVGWPTDASGACKACGKATMKVDAAPVSWFWCKAHSGWHEKTCELEAAQKCCAEKKVLAVALPSGTSRAPATYCPACGSFCGAG